MNKKNILSPNIHYAAISYLIFFFVMGGLILILILNIIASNQGLSYDILSKVQLNEEGLIEFGESVIKAKALAQNIANFSSYLISTILVIFFARNIFINDFKELSKRKLFYIIYIILAAGIFYGISRLTDEIIKNFVDSSQNQISIEYIFKYSSPYTMIFTTVILAPIVEEFIFRKYLFEISKNNKIYFRYLISIVTFTLIHVLSTEMTNPFTWLLMTLPYAISAFSLCFIYHKSNYNIYTVIVVHMVNNLIATILVL